MSYKLFLLTTEKEHCDCQEECYCEPRIDMQEVSLSDLAQRYETIEEIRWLVHNGIEKKNAVILQVLEQLGWKNKKACEDRDEKVVLSKEYWYVDDSRTWNHQLMPIDLTNLTDAQVSQLAQDSVHIVQTVSKNSLKELMTDEQKVAYKKAQDKIKKEKQQRDETKRKKQEAKEAKELERARKIIEEHQQGVKQ